MSMCSGFSCARALRRFAFVLGLLAWPALSSAQVILANDVIEPRSFGYVVGDKVRREVHLSLRSGHRLDESSLPEAGRLDRWLELAAPEVRSETIRDGTRYEVILTYQIFNAPPAPETVTIPLQRLRILGAEQDLTTMVPAFRVGVVPLTSAVRADRLTASALQPDSPPSPIPVDARQRRLAWTGAALLALLGYAGGRRWHAAARARRNRPFARAVRELKRLRPPRDAPPPAQLERYGAALKAVHEAINRTAGRAIFAHNLHGFLAAHSQYAHLRGEFDEVFAVSGSVFFAGAAAGAPAGEAWEALLRLARQCSKVERQAPMVRPPGKLHDPAV